MSGTATCYFPTKALICINTQQSAEKTISKVQQPLVLISILIDEPFKDLSFYIFGLFIGVVVITLWLIVFNSGKSKLVSHGLEFDKNGIIYTNYGDNKKIYWADYDGYIIKNNFPRLVVLKNTHKKNIAFSYYTFSSSQRSGIFDYLTQTQDKNNDLS